MLCKSVGTLLTLFVYIHITQTQSKQRQSRQFQQFEEFTKKFQPSYIWEEIDKQITHKRANVSEKYKATMIMRNIDPTDELLNFKVENGNPGIALRGGRRDWRPNNLLYSDLDPFNVRRRLLELMKQAIYQTRNKLIIMQTYRVKYNESPLYRMGFLMSTTDANCKLFTLFSFRAFRLCMIRMQRLVSSVKYTLYDALQTNERQLQLWFNIELLVDLIRKNDKNCRKVLKESLSDRKEDWFIS